MKGTLTTVLMLAGALGAGSAAAYLANGYIDKTVRERRAELDSEYAPVKAVVAKANLAAGSFLSTQTVAVREVPRAFLHSDAILANSWSESDGRVLAQSVRAGEPILQSHLAQDPSAGFSSQLSDGMRALTFPVDEESSLSGMLAPGDRIDLFFTTTSNNESVTLPLLTNVPVIATGIRTMTNGGQLGERRASGQFNTVTVSVNPDDAARITLAQDAGKVTVTLRQSNDDRPIQVARITKDTLLHGTRVATGPVRRRVEIILGGI